jgi:HAD superfamily hydrolase (TIGR01450 family)
MKTQRLQTEDVSSFHPESYDAVLCDMDGVLVFGDKAAPGAADLIRRAGDRLFVVTNDSTHTPEGLATRLARSGLEIHANHILLAGALAIEKLKYDCADAIILIRGGVALHDMARKAGLRSWKPGEKADIVLLGRDPGFDIGALQLITRAVEDGASVWVTNPDLRHPVGNGRYAYQTGALLASVIACVGNIPVKVIGKPESGLFLEALARSGVSPEKAVMLGDNPETDVTGARLAGIPVILLGESEDSQAPHLAALLQDEGCNTF